MTSASVGSRVGALWGLRLAVVAVVAFGAACNGTATPTAPTTAAGPVPLSREPFTGNWVGTYTVTDCQGNGSAHAVICAPPADGRPGGAFVAGTLLPISVTLTQDGTAITGVLTLGPSAGNVTGGVNNGGELTLRGTAVGGPFSAAIVDWNTRLLGSTMDGVAAYSVTMPATPRVGGLVTSLVLTKQ